MRQSCGRKCLVDARGQRRMGRLIQADRRATLTEITTCYNRGMQQSICEATTHTTLRRMGYNSRRPHRLAADRYRRAKRTAARVVVEAKTRAWEEFGEAMEKDYRLASKRFWQTVRHLRRGKQSPINAVYSRSGRLLTSTGDVVGRWKEYFEDLLNPAVTSSIEEAEAEGSGVDSYITLAEVTEVVKKLLGGKAPGVDEIRPEYLKSLDVVGLSWLTRLCNIAWRSGTVPLGWQNWVVVPLFKKGDRRVCSNYRGITLLSLPGKVYARVLERRIRPIVEPRIQEEQCGFRPGRGTLDQLYTLYRVLEGSWEFAQPVHMCFVDLEKAFDCVPPRRPVEGAPGIWGPGSSAKGCPVPGCPLSPVLFIIFMDRISRRSQGPEGVRFGDYTISSLLFADDVVVLAPSYQDLQHALERFAAAGMRISTSKSEAMVLSRKRVACPLQVGGEILPQVEEFNYLGVLFTSEGRMEQEIDRRIGAASAVMRSMYRSVVVKKELSRKAKLLIYWSIYVPTLTYGHELWVMTERTRSRMQAAEMSFLHRVAGRSLRDRVRSSVTREELRVEPLLLHIERGQLRWLGHLFRMPPGRLPGEVFRARPTGRRPRGRPRTRWRDYVSRLAWECLGIPQKSWSKCLGRGKSGHLCLDCCPRDPAPDERKKMMMMKNENMDPSCLVTTVQAGGGGVIVCGMFSWHTLGPLVPIGHRLNATAYLSIVSDHVHPFMATMSPSSDGYFQQDNAPYHKARIISNWFLEHDNEFTVLKWPSQSPDLNPIEHLWDVVERELHALDVHPTNLHQLQNAILLIWANIGPF
ncbi:hypothetical protein F2P79_020886 [Pimephales promelas]|nr:hypothetical protein F2P79_020886 [Pimephales promelas]